MTVYIKEVMFTMFAGEFAWRLELQFHLTIYIRNSNTRFWQAPCIQGHFIPYNVFSKFDLANRKVYACYCTLKMVYIANYVKTSIFTIHFCKLQNFYLKQKLKNCISHGTNFYFYPVDRQRIKFVLE